MPPNRSHHAEDDADNDEYQSLKEAGRARQENIRTGREPSSTRQGNPGADDPLIRQLEEDD